MTPAIAQISSRNKLQPKRPSMLDALGEFRVPLEASIYWLGALAHPWPHVRPQDAKVVMLIPGFMAGDQTLTRMAVWLRTGGFQLARSGIEWNTRCMEPTVIDLEQRLEQAVQRTGKRALLVGQSRGGTIGRARDLAGARCGRESQRTPRRRVAGRPRDRDPACRVRRCRELRVLHVASASCQASGGGAGTSRNAPIAVGSQRAAQVRVRDFGYRCGRRD